MDRKDDVISTKRPKLISTNQKQSVILYMNRDLEPIFHIYEYEEGIRKIAAHVVSEFKKRTFSVSEVSDADKSIDFNV